MTTETANGVQLPKLEIQCSMQKFDDSCRPKSPDSPLWSPLSGRDVPDIDEEVEAPPWSDSEHDSSDHSEAEDATDFEAHAVVDKHEPVKAVFDGIPIPRTGVRRSLLEPKHHGDRTFSTELAPLHKDATPMATVHCTRVAAKFDHSLTLLR